MIGRAWNRWTDWAYDHSHAAALISTAVIIMLVTLFIVGCIVTDGALLAVMFLAFLVGGIYFACWVFIKDL